MEYIKKHLKDGLIVLFLLFSLTKCTQSCNRSIEIDRLNGELKKSDSVYTEMNDSIKLLNTTISIYKEKVSGYEIASQIQNEAIKQISEAKKNIQVVVKNDTTKYK